MRNITSDWGRKGDTKDRTARGRARTQVRASGLSARDRRIRVSYTEQLESRLFLAAAPPVLQPPAGLTLLNPATIPQFVNDITNINPFVGFNYTPDNAAGNHYSVGAYPVQQDVLGLTAPGGQPLMTPLFGYGPDAANATYPARTFEVQQGSPIAVTWANGLPSKHIINVDPTLLDPTTGTGLTYDPASNSFSPGVPSVTHLHGGHSDAIYDGTPLQWFTGGAVPATGSDYTDTTAFNPTQPANTFTYRNDQQAATLWYHDHAMGVTRLNAYAGMAGFYIIRNQFDTGAPDNPLGLPADQYEMGLAIQDKQFLSDGQMWFAANAQTVNGVPNVASTAPEQFGDTIVVNGKAWPKMTVEAKRYRFRLLNASDSRFYTMSVTNAVTQGTTPIWQIGTDDGLLNAAVKGGALTLAPGERADVVLDFTKFKPGTRFVLTNTARAPFPAGARVVAGQTDRIMAFDVVAPVGADLSTPPAQLTNLNRTDPLTNPIAATPTRDVALYETTDAFGRITPVLGTPASSATLMDPITENIAPGATEVWQMYNNTADTHPIHLHQTAFQVLTRGTFSSKIATVGVDATGLTQLAMGPVTRVAPLPVPANEVAWKDTIQINPGEVITLRAKFDLGGKYVWHCHILSHEEHDMMRFFQVGSDPAPQPGVVVTATGAVLQTGAVAAANPGAAANTFGAPPNTLFATFSSRPIAPPLEDEQTLSVADQVLV
jgi:spore coat protein A, manganese oxidase